MSLILDTAWVLVLGAFRLLSERICGRVRIQPQNNAPCVCRWFQENATRSAAEELLRHRGVGQFMIRGCQSSQGEFSISVRWVHFVWNQTLRRSTPPHLHTLMFTCLCP